MNVFIISLVHAQYGSPAGNGNPGYGGTGTGVPSNDYGHKGSSPAGPSGSDGNSEVNILLRACYINESFVSSNIYHITVTIYKGI